MDAFQKRNFLLFVESKKFSYLWEEAERCLGKKIDCVKDLLEEYIKNLSCSSIQPDIDISQLQSEIKQNRETIALLNSSIAMLKDDLEKKENQIVDNHKQISSFVASAVESLDLMQRLEFDKHLSSEGVLNSLMESSVKTLSENGYLLLNEIGIPFNSKIHNIIGVSPTNDQKLDGMVAESTKSGLMKDGKCIRIQDVIVYTCSE